MSPSMYPETFLLVSFEGYSVKDVQSRKEDCGVGWSVREVGRVIGE